MTNGYDKNIYLENRFAGQIKQILGLHFIRQDVYADRHEGTDFLTMTISPFKVGCRLRRYNYYIKKGYSNQFTIRWFLPSGNDTEIHKIRKGLVDYIIYGFVDKKEENIIQYFIGDLGIFRNCKPEPFGIYENRPPDSHLAAFLIGSLPADFIQKAYPITFETELQHIKNIEDVKL